MQANPKLVFLAIERIPRDYAFSRIDHFEVIEAKVTGFFLGALVVLSIGVLAFEGRLIKRVGEEIHRGPGKQKQN